MKFILVIFYQKKNWPNYTKNCLCVRASSGSSGERKVVTTDLHNLCTSSHTGTSASAPMAAGVIALVLQVSTGTVS